MRSRWLGCLLVLAACGDSADDPYGGTTPLNPAPGPGQTFDSGAGAATGSTGGTTTTPGPIVAAPGGTGTGTGVAPGTGGASVPCEIQKILKDKCQVCHSDPPVGSPMPLVTLAHFQAMSTVKTSEKIHQRVLARINDTANPMPPKARPELTAAEKTALETWLKGGAQGAAAANCGPGTTGGTPDGGVTPPPGNDECDVVMELRAHAGQTEGDTTPYNVTASGDSYEIFWFKPTWNEKMQAIDVSPLIDNGAVLHHWLLYMKERGTEAPGSHNPDSGLQSSDSQLLSGWAPGNEGFKHPPDVGLYTVFGPNARFGIEIHYNTSANPPNRKDRSGARLCMTKKLRPKEAGTHWIGTQLIVPLGNTATGVCNVPKEAHIIAHSPHMHKKGKYMKTIITKKGGGTETITDQPFAFDDQQIFPVKTPTGEHVVQPGDVITTTCEYTSPALFGPGTSDEMCYNFVVAWPNGALSTGAGLVGGKNTCIEGI